MRKHAIVVVEEGHPAPARGVQSCVPRCREAAVRLEAHTSDPVVPRRLRRWRGPVVDNDHLDVGDGLGQSALDGALELLGAVVGRDHDRQGGIGSGHDAGLPIALSELRKRIGESLRTSGPLWTGSLALERILPVNVLGRWPGRRVAAQDLRRQVLAILASWGMPDEAASITADHLLYADLCGIDSHGVGMLLDYHRALREGAVTVPAEVRVVSEGPSSALLDGGGGLGHVPADRAMRMAIAKARETGAAAVAVRNSGHFGAAGSYAGASPRRRGCWAWPPPTRWSRRSSPPSAPSRCSGRTRSRSLRRPPPAPTSCSTWRPARRRSASRGPDGERGARFREGGRSTPGASPIRNGRVAAQERRLTPLGSSPENASYKGYGLAAMVEILCAALPGGRGHRPLLLRDRSDPVSRRRRRRVGRRRAGGQAPRYAPDRPRPAGARRRGSGARGARAPAAKAASRSRAA